MLRRYRALMGQGSEGIPTPSLPRLPSEYQEVEYIESTGHEYILTDIYSSSKTNIVLDMDFMGNTSWAVYNALLGSRPNGNSVNMFAVWVNFNNHNIAINYGNTDTSSIAGTNCFGRHIYKNDASKWYLDDVLVIDVGEKTINATRPLTIFASNDGNLDYIDTRGLLAKFYSLKVYEEETLISNLIPCYRKANNLAGLYDIVNDKFLINQGSGEFIVGEEV